MAEFPVLAGGDHVTSSEPFPGVIATPRGADGTEATGTVDGDVAISSGTETTLVLPLPTTPLTFWPQQNKLPRLSIAQVVRFAEEINSI
jgi:hypothetical protein